MNKAWKQMERNIAKKFGTERSTQYVQAKGNPTSSDTMHPRLYIECKRTKRINFWSLWYGTAHKARNEKKIPLLVLKHPDLTNSLLVCRMIDIKRIAKELV